jgi:integrase
MRPRHQRGQVLKRGLNWVLRYHEDRMSPGGQVKRVRTLTPLAPYSEYPYKGTEADIERLREKFHDKITAILASVNRENTAAGTLTLGEFIEHSYFPRLDWRLSVPAGNELHIEPSTVKGYKDIWEVHVKSKPIAKIRVRDFTSRDGQRFLESLPQHLSHQTHLRIKTFVRGVFTWAIADGAFVGSNAMEETKAGGRTKKDGSFAGLTDSEKLRKQKIQASNEHAYTLEEVAEMLDKLPEPARTVCAVAAFTGLTRSELRGLKWTDYDGETINVQRKVWNDHVGAPKTEAREAGVFVIPLLRKILTKYKAAYPCIGDGWIFRGQRSLRPLDLDNVSRRDIPQHINGAWFGWHAFRRGLGTRLDEAEVDDKEIQSILRHADISTTQASYILPNRQRAEAGLKRLGEVARKKYGIKG